MQVVATFALSISILLVNDARCQDLSQAQISKICEALNIATCDQCIRAHPDCAWCAVPLSGTQIKRCRTYNKLMQLGECPADQIQRVVSETTLLNNTHLSQPGVPLDSSVVQLQPQIIQVDIRKGDRVKFNVTFRKVSDYPVDLYYLMDLSHSMLDDLETLQNLGKSLAADIKNNITQNIQMGFGTFVDKVMMPYASTVPEQLQNPCAKNQGDNKCAPPFGFKHQQSISDNLDDFRVSVESTIISGNIDSPEGGLDALMQIAVCGSKIGWRSDATHLVVVTTDASFHMALDGKLAAILEANDMKCHLSKGANLYLPVDTVYDKSKELDYPSIGQIRSAFKQNKIQPIFAVTKDVRNLYEELKQLIPNSYVDELAADSSNIISIIKSAYNQLRGKLDMSLDDNLPPEIALKYRVLCPNSSDWKPNSLSCDQIQIGSEVIYEFDAHATECPTKTTGSLQPVIFTSSSLQEDVKIYFNFLCSCSCSEVPIVKSSNCSRNGSLVCGVCECDSNHEGAQCQCTRNQKDVSLLEKCKKSGPTDDICKGNGQCECGNCVCNEGFKGTFCECSNKGCPTSVEGICGGADKGTCNNCEGKVECTCKNGWTLDSTLQTCTCHRDLCKFNSTDIECSGKGICECNRCQCFNQSALYSGQFCEICIHPDCKEPTGGCEGTGMRDCALCVNEAQRLRENQNEKCSQVCGNIDYTLVASIPDCNNCFDEACRQLCSDIDISIAGPQECQAFLSNSDCNAKYDIVWRKSTNNFQILVKEFNKDQDCPQPINPLLIVLPIVAGIVLLGVVALIAWKIFQTIRDKREWMSFENEMKQSKWTKGQNPIFEKPSTRFENPMFPGNS